MEPTEILLRLGAATLAGALLGLDRELAAKPIGIRTLALVALGSASVCIAATDQDIFVGEPDALSRVMQGAIQGVLSGIGFLGAGVVLQQPGEQRMKFLTSAATVWVTACLGIACGIGAWWVVSAATVLALILLVLVHPLDNWLEHRVRKKRSERVGKPPAEE